MKRLKWKGRRHYAYVILFGLMFGCGAFKAVDTAPDLISLFWAAFSGFGIALWLITDVYPDT